MSGAQSDAQLTQALQTALSPKSGMRRLPFPLESYQHPSLPLSAKQLLNLYAEQQPTDARTHAALISTPGLVAGANVFGTGPIRAMNNDGPGPIYVVSGSRFYRLTLSGFSPVIDDLGSIGDISSVDFDSNLMVTIASGVVGAVVCVPPRAYTCTHTGALHQIGGDFPGARSVTYIDGYFVFTSDNIDSQFFTSLLLDPTAFDALDFAFADGVPNIIRRAITHRGEIWLLGDAGIEVWYDSGDADFPFRRRGGAFIQYGVTSPKTVVVGDNSVFWVSTDGTVKRSNGYQAVRISTHWVENVILAAGVAATKWAIFYAQNGHGFYCLTMGVRTLVYDTVTGAWHERSSGANGDTPWRPSAVAQIGAQTLFGDSLTGKTFNIVASLATDDGVAVLRSATMPPVWAGTHRAFINRLEIEMQVGGAGSPGNVLLEWSDDGGITWSGSRTMSAGNVLETRKRVFTTRLGSFHQRVFRFSVHGHATFYAVDADVTMPLMGG
jgi:hypothetical protein